MRNQTKGYGALKGTVVLSLIMVSATLAHAGAESSGGVENYQAAFGSAWFLNQSGKNTIQTCLEIEPGFPMSDDEVFREVRAAFRTWGDYIARNHLDQARSLVTSVTLVPSCDIYFYHHDLKIYLGGLDAAVLTAQKKYRDPLSFAELVHYDRNVGWGKGFIWIKSTGSAEGNVPDWSAPYNLRGILLHEIGHVMGNEHADGTIMSHRLSDLLRNQSVSERARLQQIDHERDLMDCRECESSYLSGAPFVSFVRSAFTALLNRAPVGQFSAKLIKSSVQVDGHSRPQGVLVLQDQVGSSSFGIKTRILVPTSAVDGPSLFKVAYGPGTGVTAYDSGGSAYYGSISGSRGKVFPILWTENINEALRISILPESGSKALHIFAAYRY